MPEFVASLKDKRKGTLTASLLSRHVDYLKEQTQAGSMLLCGPFTYNAGASQLIEVQSEDIAESIIEYDPFIEEAYYQSYEIFELIEADENNNWLSDDMQAHNNLKE